MKSTDVNPASSSLLVRQLSSLLGAHQSKIRVFAAELRTVLFIRGASTAQQHSSFLTRLDGGLFKIQYSVLRGSRRSTPLDKEPQRQTAHLQRRLCVA